jgi:hypothetical protein
MGLDIRTPIGLMFTVLGIILVAFGAFSSNEIYSKSLGLNLNLWWGMVLLVFGVVMLVFGLRSSSKKPQEAAAAKHVGN